MALKEAKTTQIETLKIETNKLGKILADYKCDSCGYLHAVSFIKNKPLIQCYRCRKRFTEST
jgi:DNA-directed RNA polymerase subunit RPC12/RpoP